MDDKKQPKYLYCITKSDGPPDFEFVGVSGKPESVHTVHSNGLAAVVSDAPVTDYIFNRSTAMAHQLVIQEVMRHHTVLPFSFGTVAQSATEVQDLLSRHRDKFLSQLHYLGDKAEFCLKGLWRDKELPFQEILSDRADIRRYRDIIARKSPRETYQERIRIGQMVQQALEDKRKAESAQILGRLQPLAAEIRVNSVLMDQMLINVALLLAKGAEPVFDQALAELDARYQERVRFRLVGPSPPFNFVSIPISW